MDEYTLKCNGLTIGYKSPLKVIASDISFSLKKGNVTALFGTNGIGKSTLFKTIAGFLKPLQGEISLSEIPIQHLTIQDRAKHVSIVTTEKIIADHLSVEEIVYMGRYPYQSMISDPSEQDKKIVDEIMDCMQITTLKNKFIHELSDGEQQKVMIARAMTQETPLILLDEPTAFLDYPSKIALMLLLKKIAKEKNKTIFISTHDIELALKHIDEAYLLEKNKIEKTPLSLDVIEKKLLNSHF